MTRTPLANFRDLAGIQTAHGPIAPGLLFRADDVSLITRVGAAELISKGVHHVLDLRSDNEVAKTGRGHLAETTTYTHLPFVLPPTDSRKDSGNQAQRILTEVDVGQWYFRVAWESRHLLRKGVEAILNARGPTVFHCAAGKDRTGIFAATVLSLLGAGDEAIIDDYVKTEQTLPQVFNRLRLSPYGFILDTVPGAGALLGAKRQTMTQFLADARAQVGGLDQLVVEAGLTQATRSALIQTLVVS